MRAYEFALEAELRWALCHSLATGIGNSVPDQKIQADSNIDIAWKTFAGPHDELYWALVKPKSKVTIHTD